MGIAIATKSSTADQAAAGEERTEGADPAAPVGSLVQELVWRHPFLETATQEHAGAVAWAVLAARFPESAGRQELAGQLQAATEAFAQRAIETEAPPGGLSLRPTTFFSELVEGGIGALAEADRDGSLEALVAEAIALDQEAVTPPLSGGNSVYRELSAHLSPLDVEIPHSGVLDLSAGSLPGVFGIGTTGGRATFGRLWSDDLARDDSYATGTATLTADFDVNEDGFTYSDDTFRATAEPVYADGARIAAGGFSGGALQVTLGGIDNNDILGMSGGWDRQFNLAEASEVSVSFRYQLTHSSEHEADEFAEALMSVDGVLYGTGANDYIARLIGDGNGGPDQTTGWQLFTVDLGILAAGPHDLIIGGYSNKKTLNDEWTEILIDEVTVTDNGPLIVGADEGVLANDIAQNGLPLSAMLDSGPSNGTLSLSADGSFSYTPDAGFTGLDSFAYRVSDGVMADSGTVLLEVVA